jgi:hypothetical protein
MVVIVAVATGLTALFTLGIWRVSVIAHRHDRALSGLNGALNVKAHGKSVIQRPGGFSELPEGWAAENVRYFALRLYNVGPFIVDTKIHVEDLRLGFRRRKVDATTAAGPAKIENDGSFRLHPRHPVDAWVLLYVPSGWSTMEDVRSLARFVIHSSDDNVHFRARVWLHALEELRTK